jgi:5-(carboxyamino)imidazole ribonucleotide mutase
MKGKPVVGIIVGSESDRETMNETVKILESFQILYEFVVASAHRQPKRVREYAVKAEARGLKVIIAGSGMAAHLPGVVASMTTLPVIGVPLAGSALAGLDALFAISQMPGGVPVACMAIGKAGAKNAGILSAQILGLGDKRIAQRVKEYKRKLAKMKQDVKRFK